MSGDSRDWIAYRKAVSEVFHTISQPITAVHCCLELCLRQGRSGDELRRGLEQALESSTRLVSVLGWLRKFADASEPLQLEIVELDQAVRAVAEESDPVLKAIGKRLAINIGRAMVFANAGALREVMYLILEVAMTSVSEVVRVAVEAGEVTVEFADQRIQVESENDMSTLMSLSPDLAVAARLTQSSGGKLRLRKSGDVMTITMAWRCADAQPTKTLVH